MNSLHKNPRMSQLFTSISAKGSCSPVKTNVESPSYHYQARSWLVCSSTAFCITWSKISLRANAASVHAEGRLT